MDATISKLQSQMGRKLSGGKVVAEQKESGICNGRVRRGKDREREKVHCKEHGLGN